MPHKPRRILMPTEVPHLKLYVQGGLFQLSQKLAELVIEKIDLLHYLHGYIYLQLGYVGHEGIRTVLYQDKERMLAVAREDETKVTLLQPEQYERYLMRVFADNNAPERSQIARKLLGFTGPSKAHEAVQWSRRAWIQQHLF